ncbi:hypothetical protein ACHAW6_013732 [Cyclotella cf. meneghiniana]
MPDHDPFPMRSEEARRLAASVENTENGPIESWHKMGTSVSKPPPKKTSAKGSDSKLSLVKKKKAKKTKTGEESIYDQEELDEAQGRTNDDDDDEEDDDDDEFIEAPLRNHHVLRSEDVADLPAPLGSFLLCLQRFYYSTRNCAKSVHRRVYGDTFPWDDFVRTMVLSSTLFVMIGGYWLLRSLKDPVLTALCGVSSIPKAKMLSVFVVLGVVAVYNHLLDEESGFRKEQLFYVFGTFYGVLFVGIAYLLNHPTIGLANQTEDPTRILGWVSYCGIESFGSVMVSLFWSFANSNFNLKQAKRSYGMMVATAQLGSILGPTFVNQFGHSLGIPVCYLVGAFCMLSLQVTMWMYVKMFGVADESPKTDDVVVEKEEDAKKPKAKAGILEGIHLFMKYNYVKGIFAISCLFMVEVTIVDFTMKVLARERFSEEFPCLPFDEETGEPMACWNVETNSPAGMSTEALKSFTTFMGLFGQATNMLSFLLSFFGTSAVIRYLGLRTTLLLFPSICLLVIITVRLYPTLDVVFAAMMILKANSYALNNPTKEMLYQPTSSNVKYKAKSWIDIFGARGSKALGSVVTNAFSHSATELVDKGSLVGMCVASFLIWNANFMGKKFDEYTDSGYIVGETVDEDDEGEYSEIDGKSKSVEMASRQNESDSTSCAFYDDDEIGAEEEGQSEVDVDEEDVVIEGAKASGDRKFVSELV